VGKHNDKEFQDKIKMTFRHNLEKQFRNGLSQGMYASCKVIHDRITDESKSIEDRINSVVEFCQQIINGRDDKHAKPAKAGEKK